MTSRISEAERDCPQCEGRGWYFVAPEGCNPFYVRLPRLAAIVERRTCWRCRGSGRALSNHKAHPSE